MQLYSGTKVSVTEEDKKQSYYKYFEREMTKADDELINKALQGPMNPIKALPFSDRNRLFEPGYFEEEIGYCIMDDGTAYMSSLIQMPDVTAEMLDWWMGWHSLDSLRYKIWDNEDHLEVKCLMPEIAADTRLPYRKRYQNTIHYVVENLGAGPDAAYLNFMDPLDFGYDVSKIDTPACATLICARSFNNGKPFETDPNHSMTHFIRNIDGGVELRTRFWLGRAIKDGKDIKTIPEGVRLPEIVPLSMLLHCIKEFTNLASILPELYAEEIRLNEH